MTSKHLLEAPDVSMFEREGYLLIRVKDELLDLIDRIFREARSFFHEEKNEKSRCSIPELNEGWQDLGTEFSQDPTRPDLSESFWVTWKNHPRVLATYSPRGLSLYDVMAECLLAYNEIEREITRELLRYYGHGDAAPGFDCGRDSDLLVFYYRPDQHPVELLQEPHEDGMYMTFARPTQPGLELLLPDNPRHPVVLAREQLLVMPGEILSLLSGYRIKPLVHHVRRHGGQRERLSLCYFGHPDMRRGQVLMPWVKNETNEGVDIMDRIIENKKKYLVK